MNSNNIQKTYSFFKTQLPASVAETVLKELAFTYFLYLKTFNEYPSGDVGEATDRLCAFYNNDNNKRKVSFKDDESIDYGFKVFFDPAPFSSTNEIIKAISSAVEDYYFYTNDGSRNIDTMQASLYLSDLSEEELLFILTSNIEDSPRNDSTPESVAKLALEIATVNSRRDSTALDMTCSSGSFLLCASKEFDFVQGIEINKSNALLAKMRLFASGARSEVLNGSCFDFEISNSRKFDFVFAEFPWKMVVKDHRQKESMLKFNSGRFDLSAKTTADYFFISKMLDFLKQGGIAITVVPLSTLSNLSDSDIRKQMIEKGYIREIIALPTNIFNRTSVATALMVMSLNNNEEVAFFDGSKYFKQEKRWLKTVDVDRLLSDFYKAKSEGKCYFTINDLAKHNYSLSPSHYLSDIKNIIPQAVELSMAADIFTGWQVTSAKLETIHKIDEFGVQLLQMSNVDNGIISTKLERYDIPQATVEKFNVQKGDVVISTKSLRVKSAVVDIDTNEPVVASGSIMVIRPKQGILDPYYLVAYFESDLGKQALELYQTGSVIPNLSINNVKKLPIPLLDYSKQLTIGKNYKDLRDLIISEKKRLTALEKKVAGILDNLWDSKEGE